MCVVRLSFDHGYILTQTERMQAEDLQPTDDPLIRRGKRHQAYTERTCAGCDQLAWMRDDIRFCSHVCWTRRYRGPNHPQWVGNTARYRARHARVETARGKASNCYNHELGLRDCRSTTYNWSLLHGDDPLDPLSYVSLCKSCHNRYDWRWRTIPSTILAPLNASEPCRT